jgi:hypothetical protein
VDKNNAPTMKLKVLIEKLKNDPRNLELINEVAIGYYQNPDMMKI